MTLFFKGWQWVAKGLLLLGLVAVMVWLGQRVQLLRTQNASLNDTLAKLPEVLSAEAAQQAVLAQHRAAVERLQRLLPRREEVGAVIGAMEREGAPRQVAVVITDIREVEIREATGAVAPPSGPVRDFRIAGVATGAPASLISWLAATEGLPYLWRVEDWKLRVVESPGVQGTQGVAPTTSPQPRATAAELSFTLLLSIRHVDQAQP